MELRMRGDGQDRPIWKGPMPERDLLGVDVVVPTEQGERRGRVICFGVMNMGVEYERSVVIYVPSSGTQHEAPGSSTRLASVTDADRIKNEIDMASRLKEASESLQDAAVVVTPAASKRKMKRDPSLVVDMLKLARAAKNVHDVIDGATSWKVIGLDCDRRIYVFKSGGRVDVSGFSFDHPALRKITDDEAKEMHLGKVRGQILFEDKEQTMDAFKIAVDNIK